jgi:hypothetical protein
VKVSILERRFADQKYLASAERAQLAAQLRMDDAQVKTWQGIQFLIFISEFFKVPK